MKTAQAALPPFTEHRVARDGGNIFVRDFAGAGTPFVLLHGFPDNGLIYDDLIPHLVSAGRRVITIDFLGFGASDKPEHAHYSFDQQLGDLEATVRALGLDKIIPVGHDAGGPAAVNFALKHPEQTHAVILMNAFYGEDQAVHNRSFLGKIIDDNFRQQPSAADAFAQMTYQLHDQIAVDTARIVDFRRMNAPVLLIWGDADPYLHVSVAQQIAATAKDARLHSIDAGHWPQIDAAAEVASIMLDAS
jgi:haloalkane dehalogenase